MTRIDYKSRHARQGLVDSPKTTGRQLHACYIRNPIGYAYQVAIHRNTLPRTLKLITALVPRDRDDLETFEYARIRLEESKNKKTVTVRQAVAAGACIKYVQEFVRDYFPDRKSVTIAELLAVLPAYHKDTNLRGFVYLHHKILKVIAARLGRLKS